MIIIGFKDTRILEGMGGPTVQPWTNFTYPRSKDGKTYLKELDVRYNDVSMFAEPLMFEYKDIAGGPLLTDDSSSLHLRSNQVLRQGKRCQFGHGIKRLELLLQEYLGVGEHKELPFSRQELCDGMFFVCVNLDPSGGPYDASMANWGSIKLRMVFETATGGTAGIAPADNLSIVFMGVTRRSIYHSFSGVSSSNFSGGLANA